MSFCDFLRLWRPWDLSFVSVSKTSHHSHIFLGVTPEMAVTLFYRKYRALESCRCRS